MGQTYGHSTTLHKNEQTFRGKATVNRVMIIDLRKEVDIDNCLGLIGVSAVIDRLPLTLPLLGVPIELNDSNVRACNSITL